MRSISLVAIGLAAFFMFAANGAALAKPQPDAKETPEKLPERAVGRLGALAYSHESVVTASDFSRGGRFLVTGSYGGFHVWDTTTGKVQWQGRFDMDDYEKGVRHLSVLAVRFLDSDRKILVVAQSGYALWDVAQRKRIHLHVDQGTCSVAAVSSDGNWLATADEEGKVAVHDLVKRKRLDVTIKFGEPAAQPRFGAIFRRESPLAISPDGKTIVAGNMDGKIVAVDVATGKQVAQDESHARPQEAGPPPEVLVLLFAANGKTVYSTSRDGTIRSWQMGDAGSSRLLGSAAARHGMYALALSPDGKTLASADDLGVIHLWDLEKWKKKTELAGHAREVMALSFSDDGRLLASGSHDHTACLWDLKAEKLLTPRDGHRGSIDSLAFTPDGKSVITAGFDGRLSCWTRDGKLSRSVGKAFRLGNAHLFARHGAIVATVTDLFEIDLWTVPDLKRRNRITSDSQSINALTFSADGKTLFAAGTNWEAKPPRKAIVRGFDPTSGKVKKEFDTPFAHIGVIRSSPDEQVLLMMGRVATGEKSVFGLGEELQAKVIGRDQKAGKEIFAIERTYPLDAEKVELARDGKSFVVMEGLAKVSWRDIKTGAEKRLVNAGAFVSAVAFGPRSGVLAIATHKTRAPGAAIQIWDLNAGKKLHAFEGGHDGVIDALAFADDEAFLASGSRDTTAIVWDFRGIVK